MNLKKLTNTKTGEVIGVFPESEVAGVMSHHAGDEIETTDASEEEAAAYKASGSSSRDKPTSRGGDTG